MRFPHQAQAFLRSKIFFAALASLVVLGVALVAALTWFKAERLAPLLSTPDAAPPYRGSGGPRGQPILIDNVLSITIGGRESRGAEGPGNRFALAVHAVEIPTCGRFPRLLSRRSAPAGPQIDS